MSYLQITTRCNFRCPHCCYDHGPHGGEDMSREVFDAALKFALNHSSYIAIGGGEPTMHPDFWHYLIDVLANPEVPEEGVWMATNGSQTEIALKLASLARRGVIGVDLSLDKYHDKVNEKVVAAFTDGMVNSDGMYVRSSMLPDHDRRGIRTILEPYASGRAKKLPEAKDRGCVCDSYVIEPSGSVRQCGCEGSPVLGNVLDSVDCLLDDYDSPYGGCIQDYDPPEEAVA